MNVKKTRIAALTVALALASMLHQANAQNLAKKLSNPVASLISVPFQYNYDNGIADGHKSYINVQPVISFPLNEDWNHTTKAAMTFGLNAASTYDWKSDRWAVPINVTIAQLSKFAGQMLQFGAGVRYWADSPAGGPSGWGARAFVTFLFPK